MRSSSHAKLSVSVRRLPALWKRFGLTLWNMLTQHRSGFAVLFLAVLAVFLINVAANMSLEEFSGWIMGEGVNWTRIVACGVLLIVAYVIASLAWVLRQCFSSISEQTCISCAQPRGVLIFFVSHQPCMKEGILATGPLTLGNVTIERKDLLGDAGILHPLRCSWEMILRGIHPHHHAGVLKRIYLLGSAPGDRPDDKGTQAMLPVCRAFLEPYLPGVPVIEWQGACDFEMMVEVQRELEALIDEDHRAHGSEDENVCIDITGGQKPSSAAAVLTSLNRRVTIQYVQTAMPKEAHRYDIAYREAPDHLIKPPLS